MADLRATRLREMIVNSEYDSRDVDEALEILDALVSRLATAEAGRGHPDDKLIWPLAPSFLVGEQAERYQRGMSPSASLEDQVFYLSCRFDGHQMLLQRNQRDIFDLMDRNRKNVRRAWRARANLAPGGVPASSTDGGAQPLSGRVAGAETSSREQRLQRLEELVEHLSAHTVALMMMEVEDSLYGSAFAKDLLHDVWRSYKLLDADQAHLDHSMEAVEAYLFPPQAGTRRVCDDCGANEYWLMGDGSWICHQCGAVS